MVVWLCHARVGHRQGLYPKKASPTGEAFVFLAFAAAIVDRRLTQLSASPGGKHIDAHCT